MQLGTENRNKTIAAIALMVLAIILFVVRFLPDSPASAKTSTPPVALPEGTRRIVTVRPGSGKKPGPKAASTSLDPTLRYDWLKASEDTKYQGAGRNIFRAEVEIPKPIVPVHVAAVPVVPQGPPRPPPINLKFFGFANKPGEPKRIFLSQG